MDRADAPFRRIFYVSRSRAADEDVDRIIARARLRNRSLGVSGLLVYTGGHFAQWIEGPAQAVQAVISAIEADARHVGMRRLLDGAADRRRFPDWSMGLLRSAGADDLLQQLIAQPVMAAARAERLIDSMAAAAAEQDLLSPPA